MVQLHSYASDKTSFGETEIKVPRDRDGEFEPQLVKKNQTTLTGLELDFRFTQNTGLPIYK